MKKAFIGIGKALAYFFVYLIWQFVVTFIVAIGVGVSAMLQSPDLLQGNDLTAYMDAYLAGIMQSSMPIIIVSGILTLLTFWIFFAARKKKFFAEIDLTRPQKPLLILLAVPLALAAQFFLTSVINMLPLSESFMQSYEQSFSLTVGTGPVFWQIIGIAICAPIVEEVVFRGLVYSRLKRGMPMVAALLLQALIFGVVHGQLLWVSYAFALGIIMGLLREASGTLLAPLVFHVAFNSFSFLPESLFGMEGMMPAYLAVSALVIAALGFVIAKQRVRPAVLDESSQIIQ